MLESFYSHHLYLICPASVRVTVVCLILSSPPPRPLGCTVHTQRIKNCSPAKVILWWIHHIKTQFWKTRTHPEIGPGVPELGRSCRQAVEGDKDNKKVPHDAPTEVCMNAPKLSEFGKSLRAWDMLFFLWRRPACLLATLVVIIIVVVTVVAVGG